MPVIGSGTFTLGQKGGGDGVLSATGGWTNLAGRGWHLGALFTAAEGNLTYLVSGLDDLQVSGFPDTVADNPPLGFTPRDDLFVSFGALNYTGMQSGVGDVVLIAGGETFPVTIVAGSGPSGFALPDNTSYFLLRTLIQIQASFNGEYPREGMGVEVGYAITGNYDLIAYWWIRERRTSEDASEAAPVAIDDIVATADTDVSPRAGLFEIDGHMLVDGDIVRLSGQDDPSEDGVYLVAEGVWTRLADECGNRVTSDLMLSDDQPTSSPSLGEWFRLDPDDADAAPTPIIEEVLPNHGPTTGGTVITINGSGFGEDCTVEIDGVPCTDITYVSQYRVMATVPAHAAGLENIVLTNADGVSS